MNVDLAMWWLFWGGFVIAVLPVIAWLFAFRLKDKEGNWGVAVIPDEAFKELVKKLPWVSALGIVLIALAITWWSLTVTLTPPGN